MTELSAKRCLPCEGGIKPLNATEAGEMRAKLRDEWQLINDNTAIEATFKFKNYFRTLAFVNALAYIAIQEDHHPDISFTFNTCTIKYWTHAINGLSENDYICAAKADTLLGD